MIKVYTRGDDPQRCPWVLELMHRQHCGKHRMAPCTVCSTPSCHSGTMSCMVATPGLCCIQWLLHLLQDCATCDSHSRTVQHSARVVEKLPYAGQLWSSCHMQLSPEAATTCSAGPEQLEQNCTARGARSGCSRTWIQHAGPVYGSDAPCRLALFETSGVYP